MFTKRDTSNKKWYEVQRHKITYKVKIRNLFNICYDCLLQWGFPDGRGLAKSTCLIPFKEDDLSFFYDYQSHL